LCIHNTLLCLSTRQGHSLLQELPSSRMARVSLLFSAWAAITLFAPVRGTPVSLLDNRSAAPGVVAMPISKRSRSVSKRDGVQVDLSNQETYYSINVGIGSPPQSIYLDLDTGSSDTWAFTPSSCSSVSCVGGSCKCTIPVVLSFQPFPPKVISKRGD
jgi:Eukaryotic aspartyl protease